MIESVLIFVGIIVGVFALLAIGALTYHYRDEIAAFAILGSIVALLVALFIGGLVLWITVGGFLGAVGIFMMIPALYVAFVFSFVAVDKLKEQRKRRGSAT